MRSLSTWLDRCARGLLYALIFFLPLFVLPVTLEPVELNKQTLLVVCSLLAFLCWMASMVARRRIDLRVGWLSLAPLFPLAAAVASATGSSSPYLSWIGTDGQEYMSVLTMFALTLFYYAAVNRLDSEREHRRVHGLLLCSAVIAGAVGVVCVITGRATNTVGTMNALAVYLSALCAFGSAIWALEPKGGGELLPAGWVGRAQRVLVVLLSVETLVVLLALDDTLAWSVLVAGLAFLLVFCFARPNELPDARRFILPTLLVAVASLYLVWLPSPLRGSLPVEVAPSVSASVRIARSVLASPSGLLGSGPGTYLFDYAQFHDATVNATAFWAQRFDRAASFVLTLAASLGAAGLFAWGAFLFGVGTRGIGRVLGSGAYRERAGVLADLCGWAALVAGAVAYAGNMTSTFFLFLFSALVASRVDRRPFVRSFVSAPRAAALCLVAATVSAIGILTVLFVGTQRYAAEMAVARAVARSEAGAPASESVDLLSRAVRLNRFDDAAERALARALLTQVAEELASVPDAASLSGEQLDRLRARASAAVRAAVRATDLSPRHPLNWLVRGAVYRELIPIAADAGQPAVGAYRQAIAREPFSPANYVELGKTHLVLADAAAPSGDSAQADDAKARAATELASAEQAFDAALGLKSDYAPAHYQLALTYERQGRLDDAVAKMTRVQEFNPLDVGVAFQLGALCLRRDAAGDLARAQVELERAVELAPSFSNARWLLATVYERQADFPRAIEQVQAVLEYNPSNQLVQSRLLRLRSGIPSTEIPGILDE